jgi:hypothetical protein
MCEATTEGGGCGRKSHKESTQAHFFAGHGRLPMIGKHVMRQGEASQRPYINMIGGTSQWQAMRGAFFLTLAKNEFCCLSEPIFKKQKSNKSPKSPQQAHFLFLSTWIFGSFFLLWLLLWLLLLLPSFLLSLPWAFLYSFLVDKYICLLLAALLCFSTSNNNIQISSVSSLAPFSLSLSPGGGGGGVHGSGGWEKNSSDTSNLLTKNITD